MKSKLLFLCIILGLALSGCKSQGFTPRATADLTPTIDPRSPLPGDVKKLATKPAKGAKEKKSEAKSEEDVKTFDFQKIFAQANEYYTAATKWEKIKCSPQSSFVCTKRECPKLKVKPESYIVLDKKNKNVALCRDAICNYFSARFEQTGVFINVQISDLVGIYIKVLGDSRYKEISMIGLDAYITNGTCAPMVDEEKK